MNGCFKNIALVFFLLLVMQNGLFSQTEEETMLRSALSAPADTAKLSALNKFIARYPSGRLIGDAYATRFSILLSLHQDTAAFRSMHQYLSTRDAQTIPSALNYVAMDLSYRSLYLDSALAYIDSSIILYRRNRGRDEPALLYTKAFILYKQKNFVNAESTQVHSVSLLPPRSEFDGRYANYFAQLGYIQIETKDIYRGLHNLIVASFISPPKSPRIEVIDSLILIKTGDSTHVASIRDSLFADVAEHYTHANTDTLGAKCFAAMSLAENHALFNRAEQYAQEAFEESASHNIEIRLDAIVAQGIVRYKENKFPDAEEYFSQAFPYASPQDEDFFASFGDVQEKLGKKDDAFKTYLSGVLLSRPQRLMERLEALHKELYPRASLDSIIASAQYRLAYFIPEKYQREENAPPRGKVVLAELFTGSECRPCQAADAAYDKLFERYSQSEVAVLEYHLHIPRPDPMTNSDAEERARYYGVHSTPTSIIGGTETFLSGGPQFAAKGKFAIYSTTIDSFLHDNTACKLRVTARRRKERIQLSVSAEGMVRSKELSLRIALAEDDVSYTGANGVSVHRFVVRKMFPSALGIPIKKGKASFKRTIVLREVEFGLKKYLDTYAEKMRKIGTVFTEEKFEIDPTNLYVVAFIQDDATKEVLQAKMMKVK